MILVSSRNPETRVYEAVRLLVDVRYGIRNCSLEPCSSSGSGWSGRRAYEGGRERIPSAFVPEAGMAETLSALCVILHSVRPRRPEAEDVRRSWILRKELRTKAVFFLGIDLRISVC